MQDDNEISMEDFMSEQFDALDEETPETPEIEAPAPLDDNPEVAAVEADEDTADDAVVDEVEEAQSDEDQAIVAPTSMSNEEREKFYALPPESQAWLTDRAKQQEADYTQKTMEVAETRKGYEKLDAVLSPRREQFAMEGMDDSTAINQLLTLSDFANKDPVGFSKYLLTQRGIPLSAISEQSNGVNQSPVNPQLAAMQRQMDGLTNNHQQQLNQQHEIQSATIQSDLNTFKANPENVHYDELEADMIPLVAGFRQSNPALSNQEALAKAYKAASAVNEGVSAKIAAAKASQAEANKIAKAKKDAGAAKKAGGSNIRSSASLPPKAAAAKDVDSFVGALWDEAQSA